MNAPGPLRVTFDKEQFDALKERFNATKQEVKDALRDAAKATADDIKNFDAELAAALKIRAELLKNRITIRYRYKSGNGTFWFGLNPINLGSMNAKQDRMIGGGVTAGPVTVAGAFIAKGSKMGGQVFKRGGKSRLPIFKQTYDIADVSRETVRTKVFPIIADIFQQNLETKLEDIFDRKKRKTA